MQERDPATAPTIGDRVAYVNIKAHKGAKAWEKAEDPMYALEHNLPIDAQHYLDHHLEKPLMRIFEPILKNPKELLTGDHTRSRVMATPSSAAGGIMKFAKVRLTCMGCRAPLDAGLTTLCKHCQAKVLVLDERAVLCRQRTWLPHCVCHHCFVVFHRYRRRWRCIRASCRR